MLYHAGLSEHVLQGQIQADFQYVQPCAGHVVASPRERSA